MFFINELNDLKIYKKKFLLPLNEKDKRKNSIAFLLSPNLDSTYNILNNELITKKYYNSYYLERAVLYYINQEHSLEYDTEKKVVHEMLDDFIENQEKKFVIYKGYQSDIEDVRRFVTKNKFNELLKDYNVKIKFPIEINIISRGQKIENTKNKIYLYSRLNYNKNIDSYEHYIYYNLMDLILLNVNDKLPREARYSIALYESGLADSQVNWVFGPRLKINVNFIKEYIAKNGHKKFAAKVKSNDYKDIFIDAHNDRIKDLQDFLLKEEDEFLEDELYYKNESKLIKVNSKKVLSLPISVLEDSSYNSYMRKLLYNDRFKDLKEIQDHYEKIKTDFPEIKYTYNNLEMYKKLNLLMDLSHYMYSFEKNNTFKKDRGIKLLGELLERLINDKRIDDLEYKNKTIIIPVDDWNNTEKMWLINNSINPVSYLVYLGRTNYEKLKSLFKDYTFIFITKNNLYFKVNFSNIDQKKFNQFFIRYIRFLCNDIDPSEPVVDFDDDINESSPKAIKTELVDKIEKSQGIKIDDISGDKDNTDKEKLVKNIDNVSKNNNNIEDTEDELDNSEEIKKIISALSTDAEEKTNISAARAARMIKLQNDIMDKQINGKSIRDITSVDLESLELKENKIQVDSINEEWEHIKFPSQETEYNLDDDIIQIFNQFTDKEYPLAVRDIKVEDISTHNDAVLLYTVSYESHDGKRFNIKLEIPKWIDNKYMVLRGNKKDLPYQLVLMPVIKTDNDTVQIVTNYKKIFIRRFGTTEGKSYIVTDKLLKTLNKNNFKDIVIKKGNNTKICNMYELPIDYIDLASSLSMITINKNIVIYFNQKELREKYNVDDSKGIPIGVKNNDILYWNSLIEKDGKTEFYSCSQYIVDLINENSKEDFMSAFEKTSRSVRYTYSRASILNTVIPLVVICAYSEGLTTVMKKANIEYRISEKRSYNPISEDFIKFNDAYIIYKLDYASSLLMNGLKACNTESYSIMEIDGKSMYLDFLDIFGGRINADRLDNFYNLLIDKPITYNTLKHYNLPTDYVELLLYANRLLVDNKFVKHTNITNNRRVRRQEQIAAILYESLSSAYGQYCINLKHGRNVPMTMKQSIIVDKTLENSTTSDKSIINALGEFEAYNSVTPKGPSGMNTDRSFTLDKRGFDDSMLNVVAMSTGFAGNVGITRQMTIDSNIHTPRGYIRDNEGTLTKLSPTKSVCMTEALTPFGVTRDDPFRTAMTFIQTAKHGIRCKNASPALITSGADEALPYMISNIFAHKSKDSGKVIDISEERMIVEYNDGSYDYIDLTERIEKNSSSGFYVVLKLDTDLKVGSKFKKGEILAYDKLSFSDEMGHTDNIAYNIGTLAKCAILITDEGFEDSSIISQDLSDAMTSDIVVQIEKIFTKDTNIYNLVKKGQSIEEGDTLFIAQSSYDDDDVNTLLRNLTADGDDIEELGRVPIRSKITGIVQDIKFYRTVELDELSPTLKKYVGDYEKNISKKKKELTKYGIENIEIQCDDIGKQPATGKLKNVSDGVMIEIYLTYRDRMSVGDKLIYYSANKGVVKDIFPEGLEPRSSYRPEEKIHSLLSSDSINGRMVSSIQINGGIYKGLIELSRHCKDILGIKYDFDII